MNTLPLITSQLNLFAKKMARISRLCEPSWRNGESAPPSNVAQNKLRLFCLAISNIVSNVEYPDC